MATYSKIKGGTALYLPVGTIIPWSNVSVPAGFLYCDGSPVSRTFYADLFAVIGTTFGNPDASNFNLPDFQDRSAIGASNNRTFASKNNTALASQTPNITFPSGPGNVQNMTIVSNLGTNSVAAPLPSHSHSITEQYAKEDNNFTAGGGRPLRESSPSQGNFTINTATAGVSGNDALHSHNITGNVAASFNQSNLTANANAIDPTNPYLAIRYMIKF